MPTIDVLKQAPLTFLKRYPIKSSMTGASGVSDFYFGLKSDAMAGYDQNGNKLKVLRFQNQHANVDHGVEAEVVRAHGVKAMRGKPQFYELTNASDLMFTTQLSGCCMVVQRRGDSVKVAHVWPEENQDGMDLQDQLGFQEDCTLFGLRDYKQPTCYVVGVNDGGWRFYAQRRNNDQYEIAEALEVLVPEAEVATV